MQKRTIRPMEKMHFASFHIAGFQYYQGLEAYHQLKVGTELELVRDSENKYDPDAVAIFYKDYQLGYIPRDCNKELSMFLDMGVGGIFEARISRILTESHPERMVDVSVFLKRQN